MAETSSTSLSAIFLLQQFGRKFQAFLDAPGADQHDESARLQLGIIRIKAQRFLEIVGRRVEIFVAACHAPGEVIAGKAVPDLAAISTSRGFF